MVKQTSIAGDLRSIVGADHVREPADTRDYAVDSVSPQVIAEPGTYDEVAEVIRYANERELAIIPWGGGTTMRIGNVPARYDVALSTRRLDQIIEYEPADLTVTCQAGIAIKALQDVLLKQGQMAPFDGYLTKGSTVGGALAANRSGASSQSTGTPRDFTIGMRVVTGDGLVVRAGGKVVKNVAGYDMCKLFIGSRGTLGVIVEATFKLMPHEPGAGGGVSWLQSFDEACRVAMELDRRGVCIASAVLNHAAALEISADSPEGVALYTDSSSSGALQQRTAGEYHSVLSPVAVDGPAIEDAAVIRFGLTITTEWLQARASVLPTDVASFVQEAERVVPSVHVFAQPVVGVVKLYFPDLDEGFVALPRVRSLVEKMGGTLIVESCPVDLKTDLDVFGEPPASFPLMRAVKEQFDPKNVLSPGRFVGRL